MPYRTRITTSWLALAAAGALLVACDQRQAAAVPPIGTPDEALGLNAAAPPPDAYAPTADALGPTPPIRVSALGPAPDRYRYIDDAYEMVDTFGDSPPDYAFDYWGVEPWVWRSQAGYYRVVEAVPDGYRDYYYGPQGDEPFLVRDPSYSYAYDRGALVAVYDLQGRAQPASFVARQADYAGRYFSRAQTLHHAALHEGHRAPYAAQWRAREAALAAPRQRWAEERARDPEWSRLREQRPQAQRVAWSLERQQRQARLTQVERKPDRPRLEARQEAPPPVRVQPRHGQNAGGRPEARRPVEVDRARNMQQHAVQASAREADRRPDEAASRAQAQVQHRKMEARNEARREPQAPRAEARPSRQPERARVESHPGRPPQAPNAQAHGRSAEARQGGPEHRGGGGGQHGGGPKGGGEKHDRH